MKYKLKVGDVVDMTGRIPEESMDYGQVISVSEGKVIVAPLYNSGKPLNLLSLKDALFPIPVKRYDAWGYADKKGVIVLPFDFETACPFHNGKACVTLLTHRNIDFYINTHGEWVSEAQAPREDEMVIYVLQNEGQSTLDVHETVIGVFNEYGDAVSHLKQRSDMYKKHNALFEDDSPVLFDQPNCFWDRSHYLTIQERVVRKIDRRGLVFCITSVTKANVIDIPCRSEFFSSKNDLLDYLNSSIDKARITGVAHLDSREAQIESEEYTIGVFVLQ